MKGYLNSKTIVSALLMLVTYLGGLFLSNQPEIIAAITQVSPEWLKPAVEHLVKALAAVLGVFLTHQTIEGRKRAGEEPSQIRGIWKKR